MFTQSHLGRRRPVARTLLAALIISGLLATATTTALADHGKRRARPAPCSVHRHGKHRNHRGHDRRHARCDDGCYRAYRVRPHYPAWCESPRAVAYYKTHPFFLHAGFGIYFGGAAISFDITDTAPCGLAYVDPYCHLTFGTVAAYRHHLSRLHHPALIEVTVIDG